MHAIALAVAFAGSGLPLADAAAAVSVPPPPAPFAKALADVYADLLKPGAINTDKAIEAYGLHALDERGEARLYSLWRVLFIYRDLPRPSALKAWIDRVRQRAILDKDTELANLAELFQVCYLQIVDERSPPPHGDFSRFLQRSGPNIRIMALYEEAEKQNDAERWSAAAALASEGLSEAARLGPRTAAVRAELNQAYADALADMGYSQGALARLVEAVELDHRAELPTRHLERLWALATLAQTAGEVDFADKMAQLHFRYASASPHPYWTYYLCAEMAAADQKWGRVLDCLHPLQALLDAPKTRAATFLKWRIMARARLGDVQGARTDLDRLTGVLGASAVGEPTAELGRIYLQKAEGDSDAAFEALDRWRRRFEADEAKLHANQMHDVASALEAELKRKSAESDLFAERAVMARQLSVAWRLVAALFALMTIGGVGWIVYLRKGSQTLHAAMRRAEAANEAKSRFLANMSHELRTPLNGMLGMAQALRAGRLAPDQADQVAMLQGAGEALMVILNDVLDLTQIEADRIRITPQAGDLADICRSVAAVYAPAARAKHIGLHLQIAPDLPRSLVFDGVRVRQCLSNLVSNAVKFTTVGQVEVRVCAAPDPASGRIAVKVTVADSGIGMDAETLGQLFGVFVQADTSSTRRFGGAGLGLSLTQRLAELMGGVVAVESELGRGSTFTFTFLADPYVQPIALARSPEAGEIASSTAAEEDRIEPTGVLAGLTVLVVDDHPVNRQVAALLLKTFGCDIREAENGIEALELLAMQAVDLVLMDINMPLMDGLEATRRIRGDARLSDLAILALTAGACEEHRGVCLAAGMDGYLAKPVNAPALLAAIAELADPSGVRRTAEAGAV